MIFVLKDEPLTYKNWTAYDFDRDLRLAMSPDLNTQAVEHVTAVSVILAYNKDDQQNGVEAYDRFVAAAPTRVGDTVALTFTRWNLSELVEQTIRHILSPALLPERFFGQLSYLAAQIADFTHGSDTWEQQLIPNWKRFIDDVLSETKGTRGPELIPVALIILREHARSNPSHETGWIDLLELAAIALWNAATQRQEPAFYDTVRRFWDDLYILELERFYRNHIDALAVEHSIDQLASGTDVGTIAASQVAHWHVARLGLLSLDASEGNAQGTDADERQRLVEEIANWLAMLANANKAVLRPILDIEHIQTYLMFEVFRSAGRLQDMAAVISNLEAGLYLRRVSDGGLPFIDGGNSLENVLEQVATKPKEPLVTNESSYFVLALLEMCCAFDQPIRDELLSKIHRHLVLSAADIGDPGDRTPLDLVSWIPPQDWAQKVLSGPVRDGEGVAVHRFADTRDASGTHIFEGVRHTVTEIREVDQFCLPRDVPLAVLVLAALRHRTPLPPELWRRVAFP